MPFTACQTQTKTKYTQCKQFTVRSLSYRKEGSGSRSKKGSGSRSKEDKAHTRCYRKEGSGSRSKKGSGSRSKGDKAHSRSYRRAERLLRRTHMARGRTAVVSGCSNRDPKQLWPIKREKTTTKPVFSVGCSLLFVLQAFSLVCRPILSLASSRAVADNL
jgi:hypothetical protein